MLLCACNAETEKTIKDVTSNLKDQASNIIDMEDPHVLSVKTGHFSSSPDKSIGDAFQEFFGDPTWKYFKAESGNEIVEFTGYMMYQEAKVKARLQFILNDNKSFESGALSFNDVPQNELIKASLMSSVFDKNKATSEAAIKENQRIDSTIQNGQPLSGDSEQSIKTDSTPAPDPTNTPSPNSSSSPPPKSLYSGTERPSPNLTGQHHYIEPNNPLNEVSVSITGNSAEGTIIINTTRDKTSLIEFSGEIKDGSVHA
jgi:hypothetical protein